MMINFTMKYLICLVFGGFAAHAGEGIEIIAYLLVFAFLLELHDYAVRNE